MRQSKRTPFTNKNIDLRYSSGNLLIRWLLQRLLLKIVDLLAGINAANRLGLDMGCGEGNVVNYLNRRHVIGDLVAVDLDADKVELAKRLFPYASYFSADINQLIFKDDTFDYIIATEIFEHLTAPQGAMTELSRIAKKDAYLIISVPYEPFFHWGNMARGKYWHRWGRTPIHVNFWNRSQFKQFLGQHVTIEKEYSVATFPWLLYLCRFTSPPATQITK